MTAPGGKYATGTSVTVGRSRDEIERTLTRYGATGFVFGQDQDQAVVGFVMRDRHVRFLLPIPDPQHVAFTHTPTKQKRTPTQARNEWEKAVRARWRGLALIVKAKLEAVDAGIVGFDEEFLAHMVVPGNQTIGQVLIPRLQAAIESGEIPALMPGRSS